MKKVSVLCLVFVISACSVAPEPLSINDRYKEAEKNLKQLFPDNSAKETKLTYYEALARAIKYDLDYRIKLANTALQAGQLNVATFTMFPTLNATGSIYNRDNDLASSGTTTTGAPTDVLNSTPRTVRSARISMSWNILDFAMGYVRAKQQSERVLIAQEESRKQLQQLSQDVLVSYWKAYSAQEMMVDTKNFQRILGQAKKRLALAMKDKTIPKENLLNYQAALLEGNKRFSQLEYQYAKAIFDLKHLLNLPPDQKVQLSPPPKAGMKLQNLERLNFRKLDAITLVTRPELRGQNYQERIARFGVRTALLQALPGFTLNTGWNYNSNEFLLNAAWIDRSVDIAWNLLNLAAVPANYRTAKLQARYEELKLLALTLTALTETRFAFSHYQNLYTEYSLAQKQTENAHILYKLVKSRNMASMASTQQVIIAKLRTITAKMDEDLLLSELARSLGELYLSTGIDIMPLSAINQPVPALALHIQQTLEATTTKDFPVFIEHTYAQLFPPTRIVARNCPHRLPQSKYTLQVYGSYHLHDVKNLASHLSNKTHVNHYFKTVHQGKDWYVLTLGSFSNVNAAKKHLATLPSTLKNLKPWIRATEPLTVVA